MSCKKDNFNYGRGDKDNTGVLSLTGLSLEVSEDVNKVATKADAAGDEYVVALYDNSDKLLWQKTYGEIRGEGDITLPAGTYRLEAKSTSAAVPQARFSFPVYGVTKEVVIKAGEKTTLTTLTCTLLQAIVTVGYNDEFLKSVTGDGCTTVELASGSPLEYKLTYAGGKASYSRDMGYFLVNGDNSTLALTFKGSVDGKTQKMKTSIRREGQELAHRHHHEEG